MTNQRNCRRPSSSKRGIPVRLLCWTCCLAFFSTCSAQTAQQNFDELRRLEALVYEGNACMLPGCSIKYDNFMPIMWRAVSRGYVKDYHARFVADGLRNGFSLGVQRDLLKGHRVFRNYPSAYEAHDSVSAAVQSRIDAKRSYVLGPWSDAKLILYGLYENFFVFPMGAVPICLSPINLR